MTEAEEKKKTRNFQSINGLTVFDIIMIFSAMMMMVGGAICYVMNGLDIINVYGKCNQTIPIEHEYTGIVSTRDCF